MDLSAPQSQLIQLNAKLTPFTYTARNTPPIREEKVQLNADLSLRPADTQYAFNDLSLTSNVLSFSASGHLNQNQKERLLELNGHLEPDLKKLGPLFLSTNNPRMEIAGKASKPFRLQVRSNLPGSEKAFDQIDFSGTLFVEKFNGLGFNIKPGDVPLRIANQTATMKLQASANGGTLKLEPRIDLSRKPYILSFPDNSKVLKNVQITDQMTAQLLSRANPFISGAVMPGGFLNLDLNSLTWPLNKEYTRQIAFDTRLNLNDLKVAASPLLNQLLGLVGIRANYLDLGTQDLRVTARNGRIDSSPLKMMVDDHPINIRGSVGFDKTINYTAQLPITERLVGRDAYPFLKGVTIEVPIRGTVSNPRIDKQSMQRAVGSMVQQAVQKNLEKKAVDLLHQLLKPKQ
jgi:hypothetical protein